MNQDQAYTLLTLGINVFLTGAAGSGKTYLINRFIAFCHAHALPLAITASTGIAATHIGGMTLHSWSGMGIRDDLSDDDIEDLISREYLAKRYARTSVLIIDEVSMLSGHFLANLDRLLRAARVSSRPFGGMQIVCVGDFFQLPPVSRSGESLYAFLHPIWEWMEMTPCVLTTQYRQSLADGGTDPLLEILSEIRAGDVSDRSHALLRSCDRSIDTDDHTELYTRNITVDAYNTDRLRGIAGTEHAFQMTSRGGEKFVDALKKGCLAPELLTLKKGARVMFVKNNPEAGYMNGSIGHVVDFSEGGPIVRLSDDRIVTVSETDWSIEENGKIKGAISQYPLRLAWAITVHKSQGMTLDSAVMNLLDAFVPGQGYVALSRVRSLAGLTLRGYNSIALEIDPRVRAYDARVRAESAHAVTIIEGMTEDEIRSQMHASIERLGGRVMERDDSPLQPKSPTSKADTHLVTYTYIQQGMSLDEIAALRELKTSTILSHLEKLIEEGKVLDLTAYLPLDEMRMRSIQEAFFALSTLSLTPVRSYLAELYGEEFTYEEIRSARLFLSPTDRLEIESGMTL